MRRRRQGFVLVQALVVVAGLAALMAMLAANQRAAIQETQDRLRQRRAEVAARSAVARALAVLEAADPNLVTLSDDWAVLGDYGNQEFDLGDATFRLQIVDAGSLVNVNTATEEQLLLLPLEQEQVDSLLDWREAGLQARAEGAKDEYYNALEQPYNARLGRLATLSELLLVKGWTARTLYAPITEVVSTATTVLPEDAEGNPLPLAGLLTADSGTPNTRAEGDTRVNFGQASLAPEAIVQLGVNPQAALLIAAAGPYSSFRDLLAQPGLSLENMRQFLDAVAFTNGARLEGKINLNTASQSVLETLPNMTPDIAAEIVSRQTGGGFGSLGELTTAPGLSAAVLPAIADAVTVGGDTWIVRAYGESGGIGAAVEVVVAVREGRAQVQTWDRLSTAGVPAWWDWEAEPTATVEAGAGL